MLFESNYNALDNKYHTLSVLLDLRKTFDTINYEILCSQYRNFGIRGILNSWFCEFLKNPSLRVKINSRFSEYRTINIDLSQGTTLASLLFIIYLNNLNQYIVLDYKSSPKNEWT